jgi:hypothetical protein
VGLWVGEVGAASQVNPLLLPLLLLLPLRLQSLGLQLGRLLVCQLLAYAELRHPRH